MDVKGQFTQDRTEFEWETQDSLWSVDLCWPLGTQTSWMLPMSKPLSGYCGNPNECSHVYGHFLKELNGRFTKDKGGFRTDKETPRITSKDNLKITPSLLQPVCLSWLSNSYSLSSLLKMLYSKYLAHLHKCSDDAFSQIRIIFRYPFNFSDIFSRIIYVSVVFLYISVEE